MSAYDILQKALEDWGDNFEEKPVIWRGQLGYEVGNSYSVKVRGNSSKYWVRLDNKSFVEAYHKGKCPPTPDLNVYGVIDKKGRYCITDVDLDVIELTAPNNPGNSFVGPHSHSRGSGMEFPIDSRLLSAFQVRPISGLNVYVNGGAYQYEGQWKWFGGDTVDLSPYLPVGTTRQNWAVLCVDHATSAITVMTSEEQSITSPLTLEQIESITLLGIPVGAVRLRYGQTAIAEVDMEALHILADSHPRHNYSATVQPTVNDDEQDGYERDSRWFDQIAGLVYTCIDATAGAAVWVSGGGTAVPISASKETIYTKVELYRETLVAPGSFSVNISAFEPNENLEITLIARGTSNNNRFVNISLNGDTTNANYFRQIVQGAAAVAGASGANDRNISVLDGANSVADQWTHSEIKIFNYLDATVRKVIYNRSGIVTASGTGLIRNNFISWNNTAAVTSIGFVADSGDFATGSTLIIYGYAPIEVVVGVSGTQTELFPITLDYSTEIPANRQIVLSHLIMDTGGELVVNGAVAFVGGE